MAARRSEPFARTVSCTAPAKSSASSSEVLVGHDAQFTAAAPAAGADRRKDIGLFSASIECVHVNVCLCVCATSRTFTLSSVPCSRGELFIHNTPTRTNEIAHTFHTFEFPFTDHSPSAALRGERWLSKCGKVGWTATKLTCIENNSMHFMKFAQSCLKTTRSPFSCETVGKTGRTPQVPMGTLAAARDWPWRVPA